MSSLTVWLAGDLHDPDFAPALAWLGRLANCAEVGAELPASVDPAPDAIVLVQSRPGSIRQGQIERLHRQAPLARLILIAGPWCEGELRSGRPPHGVTRMLWHQWNQQLPLELGLGRLRKSTTASRRRTLTPVDRLVQSLVRRAVMLRGPAHIAIRTSRHDRLDALTELCAVAGLSVTRETGQAAVCLADGWDELPAWIETESPGRPVILLLDWPRQSDLEQASQRGIAAVLGQPLLVTDLLEAIAALLPADAQASAA